MPPRSAAEIRVLDAVDADWAVARLAELVSVPSVTASAAESDAQHLVAGWLSDLGLDVDLWPVDLATLAADPDFPGTEVPRTEAWGLVGATGSADGPTLVLSGHIDVVPAGDPALWAAGPFTPVLGDGTLSGRGSCDMKGGLIAAIAAARAVRRSGVTLAGRLAVHSVVGEEDGGLGTLATLRRGHRGDLCVIPEPTDLAVVTAAAGSLGFRIEVDGRAAHGAVRDTGVSALEMFLPVHRALLALEDERHLAVDPRFADHARPYALSVGTVRAGDWSSTVPDRLVAEGRYGVRLGEPPEQARAAFERAVRTSAHGNAWLTEHPARVTWSGGQFASGLLPQGHPLLERVRTAAEDAGLPSPAERAVPYGSDLRQYAAAGIPTVHFGPGEVTLAHTPREHVRLADVIGVARALALLAVRTCGVR